MNCPSPARAQLTLLRAEVELAIGRRLALSEMVALVIEFAEERRAEFVEFVKRRSR